MPPPPRLVRVWVVFSPCLYPYRSAPLGFLGKCFLMCQELVPILVNVKGVCDRKEVSPHEGVVIVVWTLWRGLFVASPPPR